MENKKYLYKIVEETFTFDDVLLEPSFSFIDSRKDVDISSCFGGIKLDLPIISANMATITEEKMALAMREKGGLGILHRFCSIEDNVEMVRNSPALTGVSIGVTDGEKERAEALFDAGSFIFTIDVANGAAQKVVEQTKWLRQKYGKNILLVVGNFATCASIEAFKYQLGDTKFYPDVLKVGVGSGRICSTRDVTGCGVGQLSAVLDCTRQEIPIISDGGIRKVGDVCKALAAGAVAVMCGNMLSGTDETPGSIVVVNGKPSKKYQGSAYGEFHTGLKTSEGVVTYVPCKGSVNDILNHISGGIRSSFSYNNARNLLEFQRNARFLKVTNAVKEENKTF